MGRRWQANNFYAVQYIEDGNDDHDKTIEYGVAASCIKYRSVISENKSSSVECSVKDGKRQTSSVQEGGPVKAAGEGILQSPLPSASEITNNTQGMEEE